MTSRWLQLLSAVLAMVMIANLQYAWTLFVRPIQEGTNWTLSQIQWAFTLFIIFETWIMPLEGWLIDRAGPRLFLSVAGVLCGIGWSALGMVESLGAFYVFYSIAGVGAAFVYSGAIATALKWFPDRRGLASGLIAAGFGSGSALFIPLIVYWIGAYDYRSAFVWSGVIQGAIIILAAQVLRNPDQRDLKAAGQRAAALNPAVRRNTEQFTTPEMLRTPHFYGLYLMLVMMATGGLMLTAQAGPLAKEWGISLSALTVALALDRVANGAGRVFWGWISDRIGRETTMFVAFTLQAFFLLCFAWFGGRSGFLFTVTLVLTYFTWGQIFALFPSITGDYFGARNSASNYSFLYSAKGVASIIGGGVTAILFERLGSWYGPIYGCAVLAMLAALLSLILRRAALPRKAQSAVAVA
ncbi:MAG: oxalate/formate MFS antiporter [Bryobacteraceae bacterium]